MKRIFRNSFGAFLIGIGMTAAITREVAAENSVPSNNLVELTPFNLVKNGYQGYFVDQGVPSNGAFVYAIHFGRVDAEKLVKSAIAKGRLSSETLKDQSYLRKVDFLLETIERRR